MLFRLPISKERKKKCRNKYFVLYEIKPERFKKKQLLRLYSAPTNLLSQKWDKNREGYSLKKGLRMKTDETI